MVKPKTPLWDADAHTLAKHGILREYLEAWLPIMSRRNPSLLLIDGFAGPVGIPPGPWATRYGSPK